MAIDYSQYGIPIGAYYDSGSGTVRDANGNDLGSAEAFGGTQPNGPGGDWSFPTQSYAVTPDYGQVQVVTGGTSQPNAGIGDFTTGAAALQAQNLTPGATSLEGVPTSFNDAQGNQQYFYGTPTLGGQTTFTDNPDSAWYKNSDLTPIQGIDSSGNLVSMNPTAATAIPSQYDTAQLNRSFLMGNAGVLAAMAGAGALDAALAGGLGAGATGATAYPVDMGGTIFGQELGALGAGGGLTDAQAAALMGGTAAGDALPAGLTAADVLKYGSMAAKALSLVGALKGASGALTGSGGASTGTSGALTGASGSGTGTSTAAQQSQYYSPNGPWNAPVTPTSLTWAPHQQKPVTAGDERLAMVHPDLRNQLAQSGVIPSNLGGMSQVPTEQPYYTYGSPQQTTQPTTPGFAHGGNVHIPEFITGITGHYVKGGGTGQSDSIKAMLADGEYVMDSDSVAALGDGSSDAGAKLLDAFRESLREHKRSAPIDKIPPKASPLQYMKEALHRARRK